MNLRDRLPDLGDAGETAMEWAKGGFVSARDSVKDEPVMWSVATLALGALLGGAYALWRNGGTLRLPRMSRSKTWWSDLLYWPQPRTVAARSRTKQMRSSRNMKHSAKRKRRRTRQMDLG